MSLTNLGSRDREIELTSYQSSSSRRRRRTSLTRRSRTCSSRPSSFPTSAPCWRPAVHGPRDEQPVWAAHVVAMSRSRRRRHPVRDRSRSLPRPGPIGPFAGLGHRRAPAVEHGRCGAGSDLQPSAPSRRSSPARPSTRSSPRSSPTRASRSSTWPTSTATSATFERAATLAWTQAQVQLHHLGIEPDEAQLFQRLANRILYSDPSLRPPQNVLARNERGALRALGPTASPAICRSCWCASTRPRISTSSDSCCAPTSTGG